MVSRPVPFWYAAQFTKQQQQCATGPRSIDRIEIGVLHLYPYLADAADLQSDLLELSEVEDEGLVVEASVAQLVPLAARPSCHLCAGA